MSVREELASWIDTDVISGAILEELADAGVEGNLENGKKAWLAVLEGHLHNALRSEV